MSSAPSLPRQEHTSGPAASSGGRIAPRAAATAGNSLPALLTAPAFALQFLTIVPPLVRRLPRPAEHGAAEAFFPATGALLGLVLVGADMALGLLFAGVVRDVLLVALLAILTGALHLDGVVDTFDGLFASGDAEARLAIMRDPRAGTFGVVGVTALLGLKVATIGALLPELRVPALVLAPCLGRWAIVQSTSLFAYARPVGMGRAFKDAIRPAHAVAAGLSAVALTALLAGPIGLLLFGLASIFALGLGAYASGRLNGLSGDVYGALCELTELLVLLACGSRLLAGTS